MNLKENNKVLRLLIRTVGRLSNFFDENEIWKCFLSSIYRYENEKCERYNEFLKYYLNNNIHYCPIKSNKKKLRSELINYLRSNINNDVFNIGFTAIRHLSRIKKSILTISNENKYFQLKNTKLLEDRDIWNSEEEKIFFKNNIRMINFNAFTEKEKERENELEIENEKENENKKKPYVLKKNLNRKISKNSSENNEEYNSDKVKNDENNVSVIVNNVSENDINNTKKNINKTNIGNSEYNDNNHMKNNKNNILKRINYKNEIKKGTILIAHPLTSSTLWNKSVILITQKEKNNLVCGLILNKHPLYNNYMGISNDKEIIKILNKLYFKNKKFINEISENYLSDKNNDSIKTLKELDRKEEYMDNKEVAKTKKHLDENSTIDNIKTDKMNISDTEKINDNNATENVSNVKSIVKNIDDIKNVNTTKTSISLKNNGKKETYLEKKYELESKKDMKTEDQNISQDDFPTLKDLQEMFLRIQFRSSSKHYTNNKIKKKNNFFIMMDEHLLDIITHYIIKLNKVPLYLRFLPSYNIGSMTDIKSEIKKLQFLNEFYKIYFEKYNKWKVVIINNRIHIFDKEKNKEKLDKIPKKAELTESNNNEEKKLSEEEKELIHKKIQKFKETNKIYDEDSAYEKEKKGIFGKSKNITSKQQLDDEESCYDDDGDKNEEDDEEYEDEETCENEDEENYEDEENEESTEKYEEYITKKKEDTHEEMEHSEIETESIINERQNLEKMKKTKKNKSSSLSKININSVNKNYYMKNPVYLFWLGGPLPGLTILHNMKKFSKNIVINDLIYEGYNENINLNHVDHHDCDIINSKNNLLKDSYDEEKSKIHLSNESSSDTLKNNLLNKDTENMKEENNLNNVNSLSSVNTLSNNNGTEKKLIKRFIGKATWDLNQLIEELNNDYWIAINCDNKELLSKIIFSSSEFDNNNNNDNNSDNNTSSNISNSYKGEHLWEKILASLNKDYEEISKIPQKVIDNFLKDFKSMENE
ncbi:conserved Plasmodium protein, unknown function [Plasmodium relictum]|uniref:Glutamic acid-rich protein n=1 Tax=Plasmodium relictum TaxID=85471 RepID=A0A1J1HDB5_PLARL|nr:conserved Plasmodium protein, unknown function [Plasmodium relictum]CRH03916.1 conserved Plasmodium protein, unknown function [Plasmodium relictum]